MDKEREKQLRKILDIAQDFRRYCLNNLKIVQKDGQLVQLELNKVQEIIVQTALDCLEQGKPIRFIILKARQQGVSTIVEALIYWWTATHKNQKSKIVAHDSDTSEALYGMFRRYYDNSNPVFKVSTKYNTRSDLTFDNDEGTGLKSQIDTSSAENTGTGRGQTIHWLHGSEIAKWRNGSELVSGLMQAVPLLPNTAIFLESTANGIGDYFHTTWMAAKRGESSFTPLFFPWTIHDEYNLPVPKGFVLTSEEKKLKRDYQLEDTQIVWRREKMKEFVDKPDNFFQEYPITDSEAFLASGSPRFNIKKLVEMEGKCYTAQTYELHERIAAPKGMINESDVRNITAKPLPNAPLKVWEQPQLTKEYVIGADVAEGISGDYSVATVVDKDSHTVVARWRGDIQPSDFGEAIEQLAQWYNRALVGVEINNHGLTTVQRLRDLNYDNLYRREAGIDERLETFTSKLGWQTTMKTKPLVIDALAEAIAKDQIIDHDIIFVRECMTYVTDERGRTNAQQGCYDDTVMATAIAFQLFDWTDVSIRRQDRPSRIPAKYATIKKQVQQRKRKHILQTR